MHGLTPEIWCLEFDTVELKGELYSPFGERRNTNVIEAVTDNHPEVNPNGKSGGAVQFRTKIGGTIKRMRNQMTGEWLDGEDLFNYITSLVPSS